MEGTQELLQQHPLLGRLSPEQILYFAQVGKLEVFQPNEDIVVEGSVGDSLYLILSGSCFVLTGKSSRPLAYLKPGEFFGEMSLVEPSSRAATVRAAELTEVFRLPHFSLTDLLEDNPTVLNLLLLTMVRVLSQRLRRTNQLVGSVERLSEWLAGSLV